MTHGNDAPELPSIVDLTLAPGDELRPISRKRVLSWALWDWATQPFNSVIITFVFSALYLISDDFLDPATAALGEGNATYDAAIAKLASGFGLGATIAGVLVALLAPVLGQRADARGRRKASLGISTGLLVASMFALFFVQADPSFFWWGVGIIAFGTIVSEIAGVTYNAMLTQVSTPQTMGRVSGLGWGLGYMGGIVALVLVVVADGADWWGMDTSNGLAFRLIAVGCGVWTLLFGWAVFVFVPEAHRRHTTPAVGLFQGYAVLWRDLKGLWDTARSTLWFLLASAVYRDGLAGVFAFGAIIAASGFGFGDAQVMVFGIAANLVAGVSTIVAGRFDDVIGPRKVIMAALATITVAGIAVVVGHRLLEGEAIKLDDGSVEAGGPRALVFWIFGLVLSACVGPAQAASRSLLARLSPPGKEGEIFGLYATTGRAASFLSPAAWTAFVAITGAAIWGTVGIVIVVALGLVLLAFVRTPADKGSRAAV